MTLVWLAWCIIVSTAILLYGGCLLWTPEKAENKKNSFIFYAVLGGVISFFTSIVFLIGTGKGQLVSIEGLADSVAILAFSYVAFRFINHWKSTRLKFFLCFIVMTLLSYFIWGQAQDIYRYRQHFIYVCNISNKETATDEEQRFSNVPGNEFPTFWFSYFSLQKKC